MKKFLTLALSAVMTLTLLAGCGDSGTPAGSGSAAPAGGEQVTSPCDALVIPMTEDMSYAISAATALRSSGVRTQLYCENKKFKAKMSYADKLKVPFVVLAGEDEIKEGVLSVKNMLTGEQVKLSPADAARHIASAVALKNSGAVIKE